MIILFLIYVVASLCIAIIGLNRKFGFWGYFFASMLLSPLIGLVILFASDKKRPVEFDDNLPDAYDLRRRKQRLADELNKVDSQIDYMETRKKH